MCKLWVKLNRASKWKDYQKCLSVWWLIDFKNKLSFYYHHELVGLLSQSVCVYVWSWTFKLKKAASVDRYTLILSALDDNILYNTAILMPVHCSDLKKGFCYCAVSSKI